MRALCPACGLHHEVVRIFDEGIADHRDVYQVEPLDGCERVWISDKDLLEARARFNQEPVLPGDDDIE